MPILDLKTDLKSLKYGSDRPGGGNSNQPYIKTDINNIDSGFNRFRLTSFDDGLIRGGLIGATNASVTDTIRIGKFLTDFPKGPLFLIKQVGLQLSNPRLEYRQLPTNRLISGQGFINNIINFISNTANKIENAIGPTRVYNLGINTLAQIPLTSFGGHVVRHGFTPNQDPSKYYYNVVTDNNFKNDTNRLLMLTGKFSLGGIEDERSNLLKKTNKFLNFIKSIASAATNKEIPPDNLTIDEYIGGPGSIYGIGGTFIKRYTLTRTKEQGEQDKQNPNRKLLSIDYNNALGITNQILGSYYRDIEEATNNFKYLDQTTYSNLDFNINGVNDPVILKKNDIGEVLKKIYNIPLSNKSYNAYKKIIESKQLTQQTKILEDKTPLNQFNIFHRGVSEDKITTDKIDIGEILYSSEKQERIGYVNGYGEIITIKTNGGWDTISREKRIGSGRKDEINLTPIFSGNVTGSNGKITNQGYKYFGEDNIFIDGKSYNIGDLVKFRIQAINTDSPEEGNWMVFRAYLTELTDNTDASWNEIKYAGRGDKFYIYEGFNRKMSVSFKVAALSAGEMKPMYQKLNYLMGNLMPDYNGILMRGPLTRMTIGNWIDSQLCVLNSLSYKISNDSPWEIALDEPEGGSKMLILPHIVEVSLNFTIIGSETKANNLISKKSMTTSHIAQNNTGADVETLQYIE